MTSLLATEDIRKLSNGSFEHLIARLVEAVQESSPRLFGERVETRVVATFPGHAIVLSASSKAVRVRFDEDSNGDLRITGHEQVPLKVYSEENLEAFVQEEAEQVVKGLLSGDPDAALRLASLVESVRPAKQDVAAVVLKAKAEILQRSDFRSLWVEHENTLKRACWHKGLKEIEERQLQKLDENIVGDDDRMQVVTDLEDLVRMLRDERNKLNSFDFGDARPLGSLEFRDGADSLADRVQVELSEHLETVSTAAEKVLTIQQDASVNTLADFRNVLSEVLFPISVARCFVEAAAQADVSPEDSP
jgi:hypothetical protein